MKTDIYQSCGHYWVFQICWHIECSTFTASSFMIWNSSNGIPSLPLALFILMLLKALLSSHSRMSGSTIPFLSSIEPIAWNIPLVSLIFLKRSLVFPILFFSSISLHWSPQKGFLISPCYSLELCTQMFASFLFSLAFRYSSFSAVCKADNHFAILHAFFLGMVLITDSCTMSWISVHRSVKGVSVHLSEICKKEKGQTSILNSEMVILRSPFK